MTFISPFISLLELLMSGGRKTKVIIGSEMNFHRHCSGLFTHWPHPPACRKTSSLFLAPKHACSVPGGPCDAWGCGETGMNRGSVQSLHQGSPPIRLWWDELDILWLLFLFPWRHWSDLQFVNIKMLKGWSKVYSDMTSWFSDRIWHCLKVYFLCIFLW